MKKLTIAMALLVTSGAFLVVAPSSANAQYGQYGGYGYGPRPMMQQGLARHRVHAYVGGQLMGVGVLGQKLDGVGTVGSGGGLGLFGGVRLGPWFALEANWTFTLHDESWNEGNTRVTDINALQLQTLTADAKLHIPTYGPVEPFIQGGVGWGFFGLSGYAGESYLYTSGPAFNLGGGLDVWFGPYFSLGGRVLYRGIYFREAQYDVDNYRAKANYISAISLDVFGSIHF